jgi:hypothetical protein
MKISTLVTVLAATVLTLGFSPISWAQDNSAVVDDEIEVMTIIGKRPSPTILASACVDDVFARRAELIKQYTESGFNNTSRNALADGRTDGRKGRADKFYSAIKQCFEQVAGV